MPGPVEQHLRAVPATFLIGALWGDEGKGRVAAALAPGFALTVRATGGGNAKHTVLVDGQALALRHVPCGIVAGVPALLGPGMLVHPLALVEELALLDRTGIDAGLVRVSAGATVVLPEHVDEDVARERMRPLGTTRSGIGPALVDKARRVALRMHELTDAQRVRHALQSRTVRARPKSEIERQVRALVRAGRALAPRLVDGGALVRAALARGDDVLVEGAQGTLLDVDHGTWPHVTGTHPTVGGAMAALGLPAREVARVIGVTRAYATRQGAGLFPTEVHGREEGALRAATREYSVRIGWLDLQALRYAHVLNGFDELAVTGLDRLRGLEVVKLGDGWLDARGRTLTTLSTDGPIGARLCELPGFLDDVTNVRSARGMPPAARGFLDFVERSVAVPVRRFSVARAGRLATRRSLLGAR
ncbi:MAG: adenylosuccinate synthetase [Deltaproteobacteria bacterium]|nr:adenylosuccinate synthetase [Deltaproteobacteria bacterium]